MTILFPGVSIGNRELTSIQIAVFESSFRRKVSKWQIYKKEKKKGRKSDDYRAQRSVIVPIKIVSLEITDGMGYH